MSALDFTTASLKHSRWKAHLRAYLDGKEQVSDAELMSPKDCDLGKWLYADGLRKYGQLSEMKELEKAHEQMHATVKTVVQKKKAGDAAGADEAFKRVAEGSERVVALLAALKTKVA